MSFMPNQAASVPIMIRGTQTNPAFWIHTRVPSSNVWAWPPSAPNRLIVTTSGTRNCIRLTPTLPSPELRARALPFRSEEHTSELQSLMRISYDVFCLKKKKDTTQKPQSTETTNHIQH